MSSIPPAPINLSATKRALVIGNNAYISSPKLLCCVNDAQDISNKLATINFKVTTGTDLTFSGMGQMINEFVGGIDEGDFVVFFFAGHGSQWDGQDFFLPIDDDKLTSGNTLRYLAITAQGTLQQIMDKRPSVSIFILDCCRRQFYDGTRRANNSQSNCNIQALAGSLVAYACETNKVAYDNGTNKRNSIFTSHLLEHIAEPNVRIEEIMSRVCNGVMNDSKNGQIPVRSSSLRNSNIYFNYRTETLHPAPEFQNSELQQLIFHENSDSLHLSGRSLTDDDMMIVAYYAIQNKQSITTLNLAENKIGANGAQHLADVLKENTTLTTLYLTENQIGNEGAKHLADALRTNKKLSKLGLGKNQIGDQGVRYLIDSLKENMTLMVLYLEYNPIGAQEKKTMAALKKINKKLNISW